jgi:outer membrane lipoprotein-sorting protein
MNRFLFYINCILLYHISCSLLSQSSYKRMNDIESFKSKLAEGVESTLTITCDFKQEKQLVVLSETIFSKGQFYFKKENNIRWEYTEPYRYLIIIRDNQLYTRDDKNQKQYDIQSNKLFKEMNRFISGCIQGDILKNDKEYTIEYFESNDQYYVKLIPREEKMRQMINELQIWFDKSDLTISVLKIVESGEDYTKIDFINKKLNLDIPLEKFTFK